jgi:hypothetical protein
LICVEGEGLLVHREKPGEYVRCIQESEVPRVLFELHEVHGRLHAHYDERITLGKALRRYYWPSRFKDIREHCAN